VFYKARDETGFLDCPYCGHDPYPDQPWPCDSEGEVDRTRIYQMCFTAIVPYIVSTVSSVSTLMSIEGGRKPHEDSSIKAD
jgi:hypothetical protein